MVEKDAGAMMILPNHLRLSHGFFTPRWRGVSFHRDLSGVIWDKSFSKSNIGRFSISRNGRRTGRLSLYSSVSYSRSGLCTVSLSRSGTHE